METERYPKESYDAKKSSFFTGHSTMAQINELCSNGMGSPRNKNKLQVQITTTQCLVDASNDVML